ncbi:hypothetical protein PAMA_018352 [Pampus argenteus]
MKSWVLGPSEASSQGLGPALDPLDLPPVRDTPLTRPPAQGVPVLYARPVARPSQSSGGREKEDLVDLVLCHQGIEEEEDPDTGSLHSRSLYTPTPSTTQSALELSAFATSHEEPLSRSDSSDTNQDIGDATSVSLLNLDPSEHTPEVSPQTRRRARASLSDISSLRDIEGLSVRQLKEILARNFVNYSGCCEKWELVERVSRLYKETEKNRKSLENVSSTITTDGEKGQLTIHDDNLCRICMDAMIDCVLLECGHMVTCTKCGKRMNECPICRQYVVRAVHVFKS